MKLAVIGNSHVGMIRAASRDPAFSEHEFHWMAKAGPGSDLFQVKGSRIFTRNARLRTQLARLGMADTLDLAEFDAVVFVANTLSPFDLASVARSHVVADWLSGTDAHAWIDPANRAVDRPHFLSGAALMAHLAQVVRSATTHRLISGLSLAREIPIHVVPQPFPSETLLQPGTEKHPIFRKIARWNIFAPMADALRAAHEEAFSVPRIATVHHQPADTIAQGLFTSLPYARGSVRLHTEQTHGSSDVLHANATYGARILQTIVDKCG